ncbi:hypothetical protein CARUB_v10015294mg [Capsella rubella]|uniref:S-protein homolog n=1 Tax=Capsella rubella TaxID=81985 RepID=R0HQL5_9BRAS|nr:S-protein homolog 2 [Capsella rubella]EOA32049.1 hypothetical protein CARUB_v10015294mg [Capsella rubella]
MGSLKSCLALLVMIVFVSATTSRAQKRTTVAIHNDLGDGLWLRYHCKSGDDDLGFRSLPPGGSWSFGFKPDIFGRTLFFCRFSWGKSESHYFDIYKQSRDKEFKEFGCRRCEWKIRKEGPCKVINKTPGIVFDLCFPWNANPNFLEQNNNTL